MKRRQDDQGRFVFLSFCLIIRKPKMKCWNLDTVVISFFSFVFYIYFTGDKFLRFWRTRLRRRERKRESEGKKTGEGWRKRERGGEREREREWERTYRDYALLRTLILPLSTIKGSRRGHFVSVLRSFDSTYLILFSFFFFLSFPFLLL